MKQSREALLTVLLTAFATGAFAGPLGGLLIDEKGASKPDCGCTIDTEEGIHPHEEKGIPVKKDDILQEEGNKEKKGDEPAEIIVEEKDSKEKPLNRKNDSFGGLPIEDAQIKQEEKEKNILEKMAEAAQEAVSSMRRKASSFFSAVLMTAWQREKRAISRVIVRQMPDHYKFSDGIYQKPLPLVKTYAITTNGAVSEMMLATLCEEMAGQGIRNPLAHKHCQDVIYDKADIRF